jgi:GDP-4-dehydro-6-deoxy-D-mannose reductase
MRDAAPSSRIVLLGSAAEYGEVPIDQQPVRESFQGHAVTAYGRAKAKVSALAFEAAVTHGTEVVVARPFNVVGAGISAGLMVGAVIERLRKALADPPPRRLRVGRTTAVRDFVSVTDVARGLSLAAERGVPGEAYNFCSGVGHSVAYVLQRLIALAGTSVDIEVDSTLMRHGDVDSLIGSWDKAALELGWAPQVPLEDSLVAAWNAAFPQNEIPAR